MNIRSLLTLFLIAVAIKGYSQSSKLINDHFTALTNHDVKAIAVGYDDGAKVYSPNWEGAKTGPPGLTEVYSRYFASTPDLAYHVTRVINARENIVVEYTSGGTLSNPEGTTPAYMKGKNIRLTTVLYLP